jgi:predicted MFS family arabinose efflux permease
MLLGPIPISVFSFAIFLRPLTHELHSSRGAVSLAFTLHATMTALTLTFAGRLIDRFGPRKVILVSSLLTGLVFLSANLCSGKLWQLYLFYAASGVASCGVAPVSYSDVISHWFDRRRGTALGLIMAGLGIGAVVMPSAAHSVISTFGWRTVFVFSGWAILLISLPVLALFLKDRPQQMGLAPDGGSSAFTGFDTRDSDSGASFGDALRTPTLWLLLCAFVLVSSSVSGCTAHIAAILADQGLSARTAALATSVFGGGLLVGRTGSGYLLDRFFAPRVAALIFGCAAAAMGLLRVAGTQGTAFAAAFVIGLGLGAEIDVMAYLTSRYFGLRSFGAINGFLFAGFGVAAGSGAYLMGASFDLTGSYAAALMLFCILTLIGAVLMMRLGPYRYQKSLTDDRARELRLIEPESQVS